jgi:hypothetical protein
MAVTRTGEWQNGQARLSVRPRLDAAKAIRIERIGSSNSALSVSISANAGGFFI